MKYLKVFTDFVIDMAELDDAERGRLFTAMLMYADTGEPQTLTGNERFLWRTAMKCIDAQRESYDKRCEVNKKNITSRYESLRTATNRNESLRMVTNHYESKQEQEQEQEQKKETLTNVSAKKESRRIKYPTLEEVKAYAKTAGLSVDCDYFYKYFTTPNANGETWIDSQGNKVRNWKQKLLTWSRHSNGTATVRRDKYSAEKYEQHPITEDMLKGSFLALGSEYDD